MKNYISHCGSQLQYNTENGFRVEEEQGFQYPGTEHPEFSGDSSRNGGEGRQPGSEYREIFTLTTGMATDFLMLRTST